ncbi:sugar-transfer associated ATP-grasp domain-containing protein [Haloarchaeobius sp. DYHT-AS-18]|uniref:sugar-transfer associated ATP-grasp domain-containing protein n=1 Tax=Haloarchaeobius sp. DYHT-AS-18 TaxID=3446117 RepID=UPI003EBD8342
MEAVVPIAESLTFAFQLMLAGTVIAILRNEAGVSTFGVFGPVILAFAWLEVGAGWGFLLLAYVFIVTATARSALSGLDIGTPHRVASLLVIASVAVFVLQTVGQLQSIPPFHTVLLFPIILSTWYAERFIGSVAETGWAPATRRLSFTLLAIVVAFLVAGYDPLVQAVVRTPEAWAGLVAVNVFLGAGTDIRVGEYVRFRVLRDTLAEKRGDVLTMRVRNRDFISRYNPGALMDSYDKARMKQFLHGLDIPTPETFLIVDGPSTVADLRDLLEEQSHFVIKPIDGSGGKNVLVVRGRNETDGRFVTNRGSLTADEIVSHARAICNGGTADYGAKSKALVEALVTPEGLLGDRVNSGVPDLRVITLHGYPVMAMVRLPTEESKGTANIHTGAVAVAVHIASGEASGGYQQTRDTFVTEHPDTGASLSFSIPEWERVLTTASRAAIASGFGYTGVDIVFDAANGPMVLEVNRRPGLGIQNANMAGLVGRLRFVEAQGEISQFTSASERVRNAITWSKNGWESGAVSAPPLAQPPMEVQQ